MKYIVVTGGVLSSVGKGISSSSVGVLLKMHGLNVTAIKIDPYLNQDAGTISPYEHGECFITADGMPVDLDLGSYERFLDIELTGRHNITSGKVMQKVLQQERAGAYLGKTVQLVPHFTDALLQWIREEAAKPVTEDGAVPDVCLIEIGGTVGDIEIGAVIEAIRQLTCSEGPGQVCHIHVSLIVSLHSTGEQKTKPVQNGVRLLRKYGINPDFLFLRCKDRLEPGILDKLQNFCQVRREHVIGLPDVVNIYEVPLTLEQQDVWSGICRCLQLAPSPLGSYHQEWTALVDRFTSLSTPTTTRLQVGFVGKYTQLTDTYLSLKHAVQHASLQLGCQFDIHYIDSEQLASQPQLRYQLTQLHCIIIPGGYGKRGIEGMKTALTIARTQHIPCLGICLGMQLMVIELMESHGHPNVTSEEFEQDPFHQCVVLALSNLQQDIDKSTRLGMQSMQLVMNSTAARLYRESPISERHRHRYAVDFGCVDRLQELGMETTGVGRYKGKQVAEIVELQAHPFYMGVQFHPEFRTNPLRPHPLFLGLITEAIVKAEKQEK